MKGCSASLHFTLASRQLMGDPLYRCPLAAKQGGREGGRKGGRG